MMNSSKSLVGQSLGRYQILEQIGEGGMAVVYQAHDTHVETEVAIKFIRIERFAPAILARTLKRFEREAKALGRLTHPNIVKITDYGEHEGSPYLVMPYLPGGSLKGLLEQRGRIPWQEAARILLPVARALAYAHEQGIVHRDVKPANILLSGVGEPLLTDFGVAKVFEEEATVDLTETGMVIGTPEYMAPEQIAGRTCDHRADIYSLGIVFYEMITGSKPYQADTPMAVMVKQTTEPLPRPKSFVPDLPDAVERVLLKALTKQVPARYQSMKEFVAALEALAGTGAGWQAAVPVPGGTPARRSKGWIGWLAGIVGGLLCCGVLVGAGIFGLPALLAMSQPSATPTRVPTALPPAGALTVINDSGTSIFYLYISPTTSTTWGDDVLGSSVIPAGESLTLSGLAPGSYDLKAEDSSHNTLETWMGVEIRGPTTWVVDSAGGGGGLATLNVVNDSGIAIFYLYISPSTSSSWGEDQLGASTIPAGGSFAITGIPPGIYDLKAEDSSHNVIETQMGVSLSGEVEWAVTSAGGAGGDCEPGTTRLTMNSSVEGYIPGGNTFEQVIQNFCLWVPENGSRLRISISGYSVDLDMYVDTTLAALMSDSGMGQWYSRNSGDAGEEVVISNPGGVYYIQIVSYNGSASSFTISNTFTP